MNCLTHAAKVVVTGFALAFVPRVAAFATQLFKNNVQLTTRTWIVLGIAVLALISIPVLQRDRELSNSLASLFAVFQGLLLVSASWAKTPQEKLDDLFWVGIGVALTVIVRSWSPLAVSSRREDLIGRDFTRVALVVAMGTGFAVGAGYPFSFKEWVLLGAMILWPRIASAVWPNGFAQWWSVSERSQIGGSRLTCVVAAAAALFNRSAAGVPFWSVLGMAGFGLVVWGKVADKSGTRVQVISFATACLAKMVYNALISSDSKHLVLLAEWGWLFLFVAALAAYKLERH